MARNSYSEDTKAAVMAALLAGQSVSQVAEAYDIPRGTVAGWSAKVNDSDLRNVSNTKKEEVGDLLVSYLRQTLETLRIQSKVFSDETWLMKQNAADAAVLHGVMTDKAVRLIEAFGEHSD